MTQQSEDLAGGKSGERTGEGAPMDERTLTALQGSIEKWKSIEAGTEVDRFYENCPLCREFAHVNDPDDDDDEDGCFGCPVRARTGRSGCEGSPWDVWNVVCSENRGPRKATTPELVALARAEREFLESLLPTPGQSPENATAK